jgi:hypothetical protein
MADEPLFLMPSIECILALLEGDEELGHRAYPLAADKTTVKMSDGESVRDWFIRCAVAFRDKEWPLERWQAADDLAIIAIVKYRNPGRELDACSIQVVKTEGTLQEYLDSATVEAHYLRFDYDYDTLGPMFTHPLPHVHTVKSSKALRLAMSGETGNVIVDFLEAVCCHFHHDDWILWMENLCEPTFNARYGPDRNPLRRIIRAFEESKIEVLRSYPQDIQELKKLLQAKKDEAYSVRATQSDWKLLRYP